MKENTKYLLKRINGGAFYAKKTKGLIKVYIKFDGMPEEQWIDKSFTSLIPITEEGIRYQPIQGYDFNSAFYMLVKDSTGNMFIIELSKNKQYPLDPFNISDINEKFYERDIYNSNIITDFIINIIDYKKKLYRSISVIKSHCDIFSPIEFTTIDSYKNGVIIDGTKQVNFYGDVFDFSDYEDLFNGVYYNKNDDDYIYYDYDDGMIHLQNEYGDHLSAISSGGIKIEYNKGTGELKREQIEDSYNDWEDMSNTAFEGYSRLDLGLDD